jgi:hypothetical protein
MALPASVQRQADEAAGIQQAIIEAKDPTNEGKKPAVAAPVRQPPDGDPENWEGRFKGLQQTHQTTVEEMKELRGNYDRLQTTVDELKAAPAPAPVVAAASEPEFTDAEVKEYGKDFLEMVARVAKSGGANSSVKKELAEVKSTLDGMADQQHQTAEDKFYAVLDKAMPDWEAVNAHPEFKAWMATTIPLTNQQRQKFLENAHKRLDAEAVLEFFVAWKGESGGTYIPPGSSAPSQLVDDVVDESIYRAADIKLFYDEKARGKWKGREAEARQIELKIFKAQKENRVR